MNDELKSPRALKTTESQSLISEENKESTYSNICRICFDSDTNDLIQPCNCKGSHAFAHSECIKTWILHQFNSNNKLQSQCEICNADLSIQLKFSRSWKLNLEDQDKRHMFNFKMFILCIYLPILSTIPIVVNKFCSHLISSDALIKLLIFLSSIPAIILIILLVYLIISTFYIKQLDYVHIKSVSSISE